MMYTIEELEKKSDQELGLLVTAKHHNLNEERLCKPLCNINSWADMGPIIMNNCIDIEWPEDGLGDVGQVTKWIDGDTDIMVEFTKKHQGLRSAAIVYLMME